MHRKKLLEEMSWTEVQEMMKTENTVLIPTGSVEVEGPHLPLAVDSIVAMEIARRVADRVEDTVVAPLVNVTYSDWHMGFPGTMTLSMPTHMQVLKEICQSLIHHGFKRFFFVNSHVGNDSAIWTVGNEIAKTSSARAGMVSIWALCTEMGKKIPELKENTFLHAGEIMTSVVMAIRPDLVNMDQAVVEYLKPEIDSFKQVLSSKLKYKDHIFSAYYMSNEVTESGVMGDPTAASKEKGEIVIKHLVDYIGEVVEEFKKLPVP